MSLGALWRRLPEGARKKLSWWIVILGHQRAPQLASKIRQRWTQIRNPYADISFGEGCYVGPGFSVHAPWGGTFRVGPGSQFRRGFRAELMGPESSIEIGKHSVFTSLALLQCGRTIKIGDRSAFGQATFMVDGAHKFRDLERPALDQGYDFWPIVIGDDVMVLTKCTVVASIQDRAVVGANSVVSAEIPAYSVAVGSPARVVDYFGPPKT